MIASLTLSLVLCASGAALPQEAGGAADPEAVAAPVVGGEAQAAGDPAPAAEMPGDPDAGAPAQADGGDGGETAESGAPAADADGAPKDGEAATPAGANTSDEAKNSDAKPDDEKDDDKKEDPTFIQRAQSWAAGLWDAGVAIWTRGGWAMIALAVISYFIFFVGFGVWLRLRKIGLGRVPEVTWRRWIHEPDDRSGEVGAMFDRVDEVMAGSSASVHDGFDEVRTAKLGPFERDLKLMNIAVGAAPLVGLLGTVTGMLATFNALGAGSGGDKTMDSIAEGISEALYTTETGLVVALPGLFFHYFLSRRFERFKTFLSHVQAVWSKERLEAEILEREANQRQMVRALVTMEVKKRVLARFSPSRAGA